MQPNKITRDELYQRYNIPKDKKIILLIGQVLNDFSLTRDLKTYNNSIHFYMDIIEKMQNFDGYHLFIKLHPWENYKQNSTLELSKKLLEKLLVNKDIHNFTLDYNVNIDSLIEFSEVGITSCSQAGLEMLYNGKRVLQVGNAFYGFKGWTIDITDSSMLESGIRALISNPNLSLTQQLEVKKFMYHLLEKHSFKRDGVDINFSNKFINQVSLY
ncbi:hypothetical protein Q73_13025, partial [Bacillus coahuilensis m2-6]|uniref:capsular polysaccharide export protein, LipB/KpsS family n=1 Tax=Bacillus coahuilensis TaxID=408580 RepID=UPI0007988064